MLIAQQTQHGAGAGHHGEEFGTTKATFIEIAAGAVAEFHPEAVQARLAQGAAEFARHYQWHALALKQDAVLTNYSGRVEDSGEGRWTVQAAIERGVPADVITSSLFARFRSRETPSYADKLLSAMRHGFGGHGEAAKGAGGPAARPTELRKGA